MKQKEETIRELAVLPAFLFLLVLDMLVQPVGCSNLCQLAGFPRRQSVSEGSHEWAWHLRFFLCPDVSALPVAGGLVVGGTSTLTPGKESFPILGWLSARENGTCITSLFTTPNGIKAEIQKINATPNWDWETDQQTSGRVIYGNKNLWNSALVNSVDLIF